MKQEHLCQQCANYWVSDTIYSSGICPVCWLNNIVLVIQMRNIQHKKDTEIEIKEIGYGMLWIEERNSDKGEKK